MVRSTMSEAYARGFLLGLEATSEFDYHEHRPRLPFSTKVFSQEMGSTCAQHVLGQLDRQSCCATPVTIHGSKACCASLCSRDSKGREESARISRPG